MNEGGTTGALAGLNEAISAFLRRYPPFSDMECEALAFLAGRLALGYYPAGSTILAPPHGQPDFLYIVQRGTVRLEPAAAERAPSEAAHVLGPGECFPVGALLERRPADAAYTAASDTFCYQLASADFAELLQKSPRFRDFATRHLTSLLRESQRLLSMQYASSAIEQQALSRSLRSLIRRPPLACLPSLPLEQALAAMQREKTGSIVIVTPSGEPLGILTRHDVLDRVALARADLASPVERVMSTPVHTLAADATAYDAVLAMARYGVRHLPVVEEGKLVGVVTERDLFALQRVSMRSIHRTISGATDSAVLRQAAEDIRRLAIDLLQQGTAAEQLVQILSTLNDALTRRIIELEAERHDLAGTEWCWLAFGSEGRYEQTLASDQDNGLIFALPHGVTPEQARRRLLPFAQAVNRTLDVCGFPLCRGDIMAGNPRWCLSLDEWREQFAKWVRDPEPEALLNATIHFDFRPLYGAEALAAELRQHLIALTRGNLRFLRQLAQNALEIEPPLGMLRDFVVEESGEHAGTLDLKLRGARLFVDAARVIALAAGVEHTATAQRLRIGGARLNVPAEETEAAVEAFYFIQQLRLRTGSRPHANRLDPQSLNEVDRRILKECFRQARKLQMRLRLDYQL
jgi:CBS domain-containing protein